MSDYFGPQTPPGTVFSNTSGSVSWRDGSGPKDKAVLRGEPFRKYAVEAILLDLIAELRLLHKRCCPPSDDRPDHECRRCKTNWPCRHIRILDGHAERLKEVQDE